jgi:hypothetical protein
MTKLWKKEVRLAVKRGCWVAIGSHPSVLGLWPARMKAFEDFVEWLVREEVAVMTLGAAAEWWSGRAAMKASNPSPAAIPTAKRV